MVIPHRYILAIWIIIAAGIIFAVLLTACNHMHRNRAHPEISNESIERGEQLAAVYCQSCHLLPDPALIDTKSWEKGVLPHMGPLLGIFEFNYQKYPANINDRNLGKGFYPERPMVKPGEWQSILDYYTATSPDTLSGQQRDLPIDTVLPLFTARVPSLSYEGPLTSFVQIDPVLHTLVTCDLNSQNIFRFNKDLVIVDSLQQAGRIVDVILGQTGMLACNIGVFNPTNEKYGKGQLIAIDTNGHMHATGKPLFDQLQRPVQMISGDLNADGKTDYLICEFGYLAGALSWMENNGDGTFERHVIRPVPGALKAYVQDYNHDGLPDFWVLFAQGEEGIFLYTNKGKGRFGQEEVLRFPPSYGSSGFELADFNRDGNADIVYTCGDNADYSTVLKPYHGVYIYMNDGSNHFRQQFFYPVNGCYKAIARDFDNDGDLDIATISFFADYKRQPEEGFVYFENKGDETFLPFTSLKAKAGRWITMDAGDIDGDGKTDLVLGNFSFGPTMMTSAVAWEKGPPFLLLMNTGKR